jgi:uncharacterized protein YbjT (DUF2867 family)
MRVFVAGGTGAIGGHVILALIADGHSVTALARSPEKAARLRAEGADTVTVSIFDRAALTKVVAGHDAIVNLATAIPSVAQFMRSRAWRAKDSAEGSTSCTSS